MSRSLPQLGPFQLLRELGRGANGVVYEARREGLGRSVAVKVLLGWNHDEETLARFRTEANVASRIEDPGVVRVHDFGLYNGQYWYAMDLCRGPTLQDRLADRGRMPWADAARLLAKVARTMGVAHAQGVIHRDLKPANIILDVDYGLPRITDFGLARDRSRIESLTRTGTILGTPLYMAPEQVDAKYVDQTADVYALGVILYQCLTGRLPIEAESAAELFEKLPKALPTGPREHVPDLPLGVEAVCLRAISKAPRDRYASAAELAEALERVLAESGESLATASQRQPLWIGGAALVGVLLLALIGVLASGDDGPDPDPAPPIPVEDGDQRAAVGACVERMGSALSEGPDAWTDAVEEALKAAPGGHGELARWVEDVLRDQTEAAFERADASARELKPLDPKDVEWLKAVEQVADPALRQRARWSQLDLLWRRARYSEALTLAKALRDDPARGLEARHVYARTLEKLGLQREAWEARRALWRDDREGAFGLTALAEIAWEVEDPHGMLHAAEGALRRSPDYPAARVMKAQALITFERQGEVGALLEGLDDPDAVIARLSLVRGDMDLALKEMDRARWLTGDRDPEALRHIALLRLMAQEREEARAPLDAALRARPGDIRSLLLRAMVNSITGDRAGWRRDLQAAHAADSTGFESYLEETFFGRDRRMVRKELGLPVWSPWRHPTPVPPGPVGFERIARRVERVSPRAREALRTVLWIAAEGWDPWEAIAPHVERALRAAPEDPLLALEVARLAVGRDRPEAREWLERARRLEASEEEVAFLEARAVMRAGNYEEGIGRFKSLMGRDTTVGRLAAAEVALIVGRFNDAARHAGVVLSKDPLDGRAWALSSLAHQYSDARNALLHAQKAIRLEGSQNARTLLILSLAESTAQRAGIRSAEGRTWQESRRHMRQACATSSGAFTTLGIATDALITATRVQGERRESILRRLFTRVDAQLQNAMDLEPNRSECWLLAGLLEPTLADVAARWKRAYELNPKTGLNDMLLEVLYVRFGKGEEVRALVESQRARRPQVKRD